MVDQAFVTRQRQWLSFASASEARLGVQLTALAAWEISLCLVLSFVVHILSAPGAAEIIDGTF